MINFAISQHEHPFHKVDAAAAEKMTRAQLIEWLIWCDSNGVWSDQDAISEGYQPLTHTEAYYAVLQILKSV